MIYRFAALLRTVLETSIVLGQGGTTERGVAMSAFAAFESFLATDAGGFLAYTAFVAAILACCSFVVVASFRKRFP